MKNKLIKATIPKQDFVKAYLMLFNGNLKLTPTEIEILESFINKYLELSKVIKDENILNNTLFSTDIKKEIKVKTKMSSDYNFNNYIQNLKKKSVILVDKKGKYSLNKVVIPVESVTFEFNII